MILLPALGSVQEHVYRDLKGRNNKKKGSNHLKESEEQQPEGRSEELGEKMAVEALNKEYDDSITLEVTPDEMEEPL